MLNCLNRGLRGLRGLTRILRYSLPEIDLGSGQFSRELNVSGVEVCVFGKGICTKTKYLWPITPQILTCGAYCGIIQIYKKTLDAK